MGIEHGLITENLGSTQSKELLVSEETIWSNEHIALTLPDHQAIPSDEGTHVQVLSLDDSTDNWKTDSLANILNEGFYSLAAARKISDSGLTSDLWVNIHWNSQANFDQGANVFGRKPASETAWGKPVSLRKEGVLTEENQTLRQQLKQFSEHYLPKWESLRDQVDVFQSGINVLDSQSEEFIQEAKYYAKREDPWQETLLWANDKFSLVSVDNPHLSGVHLVIHPRNSHWEESGAFRKPWQTNPSYISGFLESVAILKMTQQLLSAQNQIPFYNPEIHYSGNWAKDLLPEEKGGKLKLQNYHEAVAMQDYKSLRDEKRQYQTGEESEFKTSMHGHLYATKNPEDLVSLPVRPKTEVPDQWEGIQPISPEETSKLTELIRDNLTVALETQLELK